MGLLKANNANFALSLKNIKAKLYISRLFVVYLQLIAKVGLVASR